MRNNIQSISYSEYYKVNIISECYKVNFIQCTVYSVQCTLYSMYTVDFCQIMIKNAIFNFFSPNSFNMIFYILWCPFVVYRDDEIALFEI